ncbi:hypothetical protein PZ895_00650 [Mesorhizobium sp. YIM 152430]|uniref:hypothetical protein n=1 Tax=Mesorhizobium sp. YIM 152430 TaxID=3031761 RepID=UPI0023DBBF94|nr:hypothetical protein [Mesorhizobium sp. YIM 152430]MDF1598286.1 hypothetical protein [Mesorhizobium sp. YIM 152430]
MSNVSGMSMPGAATEPAQECGDHRRKADLAKHDDAAGDRARPDWDLLDERMKLFGGKQSDEGQPEERSIRSGRSRLGLRQSPKFVAGEGI